MSDVAGGLQESTKIFYKRRRVEKVLLLEDPEEEEKDEEHEERVDVKKNRRALRGVMRNWTRIENDVEKRRPEKGRREAKDRR